MLEFGEVLLVVLDFVGVFAFLDYGVSFSLEELFLSLWSAWVFGVYGAVGFEGAPVRCSVLFALLFLFVGGVGGDVGEDAGADGAGDGGAVFFG